MATNYNYTENGRVYPFDDVFVKKRWLDNYGELWLWGSNAYGQLGTNDTDARSTPVQEFTSSTNWKQVSISESHTAAIKTDGTLWLWGHNNNGQLGIDISGASNGRTTPVQEFTSSTNWKHVACGNFYTSAIKHDGTLWSWGLNALGNLGVNDTTVRKTPVQEFSSSTNWKRVHCGGRGFNRAHTLAIKNDGTLWGWGENNIGGLGVGDTTDRLTPVQEFTSSTNWKQAVTVGNNTNSTMAIKTDGTLWYWGWGGQGFDGGNTPRQVESDTDWKQISFTAYGHVSGIKKDGTLWTRRINAYGELGVNDLTARTTFVQEYTSSTTWKQVHSLGYTGSGSSGGGATAALKTDGTLWLWGRNVEGQLADSTNEARSTPNQEFTSSTNWISFATDSQSYNQRHAAAIKSDIRRDEDYPILY